MKKLTSVLAMLFIMHVAMAQKAIVKGTVTDTLNHTQLANAVVSVLQAKDSILYKFQRTNEKGHFEIKDLKPGKYLVMVNYPKFADYVESVTLADSTVQNMGAVKLTQKSRLLQEVVIKQQVAAIRFKGDTTEFNADSFKTVANANVEDLLKILPGISVDNKGQVTAMGQKVKKVLVDGEEFFGDDPTLVTKNLRADMVDKVQVFDKKSEQADFTGVDDGEKSRTINITLKDNKKKGYFGRASAGGGTDGYFDTQLMFNLFKGKKKFAAYGIAGNTNKIGLNWDERAKFGQGDADNVNYDETMGYYEFTGNGNDGFGGWGGQFDGQGFPLVQNGGLHFEDKWNEDKQRANVNAKAMRLGVEQWSANVRQQVLNNSVQYANDSSSSKNVVNKMRGDGMYEWKIDSFSTVQVKVQGGRDNTSSFSNSHGTVKNELGELLNESTNKTSGSGQKDMFGSNLLWKQKFKKKGRTFSLNLAQNYDKNNRDGFQLSRADVYAGGVLDTTMIVDQHKITTGESMNVSGNATYTEPLGKYSLLQFSYGLIVNNNHSGRNSFNIDGSGKYALLDSLYSNDFAYNVLTNTGGLAYNYNKKKFRFNIGVSVGSSNQTQENKFTNTVWKRSYVNWNPRMRFTYNIKQQTRFSFGYNGNTGQPSISQLQPLVSNDNQINIYVGNPNLKPAFYNSLYASFSDYKILTERNIWVNFSYNTTFNDFSTSSVTDAGGRTKTMTVNVNGNQHFSLYYNGSWKVKPLGITVGVEGNSGLGKRINFVNGEENKASTFNASNTLSFYKYKEKVINSNLSFGATYNSSVSSIQSAIKTSYWTYNITGETTVFLPWKLELTNSLEYFIRPKTNLFPASNMPIWFAAVTKKIGKKDVFSVKAAVEDILGKRVGLDRNMNGNTISQNTYGIIGRYAMLSFIWNFNKFGAGAAAAK
ncbi:MAG: outer membrane beta-barrel protein [Chitinophaga sp.]|uniref:outer membrane beta-barrel protein n=1 Tax=Chitinophaga sp. TaxID=1869181 RepID=UPI0025BA6B46|nr:outer membrane beta-barrel protein [Chitinophaga sp.]MBV8251788.1 outer membrane beta-barrel protein [Chitinophaga sp.]